MAQGIDFTALIRGQQAADTANWANIRRIQDQDDYALKRESALAKHLQEQQGREAATYLSTVLPNLQRYADNGLNPVDALVNQMQAIQNDPAFQGMAPQVQQQIHQGLRQTAALQAEALAKAGNYGELQRLTSAFGQVNPVNPLGEAISTGDPMAIFNAVKARGANIELVNGEVVDTVTGQKVPLLTWTANVASAAGATNSAAGSLSAFHAQGQQDRTLDAAAELQKQQDTQAAVVALQAGLDPERIKVAYPNADPSLFAATPTTATTTPATGTMPGVTAGFATNEALTVPGAAPAAAAVPTVPEAVMPGDALARIGALVQSANTEQLQSSARTLTGLQQQLAQQLAQLTEEERQWQAQIPQYAAQSNAEAGLRGAGTARHTLYNIQQRLAAIQQERAAIGQSAKQLTEIARKVQTRAVMLSGPAATPTLAADWATQLEKELSK